MSVQLQPARLHKLSLIGMAAMCSLLATPAMALYKVVGPDGKVTYTDRAPSDQPSQSLKTNGSVTDAASLPFELRQAVGKYPITLYTSTDCTPCDQGRTLLKSRGVPFTEKTITTEEDSKALQRLEGVGNLPVLRIGTQQIKGFATSEWSGYLDAADYPKQSKLPPNYAWAKPAPLVPPATPAAKASEVRDARRAPAAPRPPLDPDANPTGIKF